MTTHERDKHAVMFRHTHKQHTVTTTKRKTNLTVKPSDCATSFSWCGKTRSIPPAWTSSVSPRNFRAIALHSMCHPGRPFPSGVSQNTSPSSGLYPYNIIRGAMSYSGVVLISVPNGDAFVARPLHSRDVVGDENNVHVKAPLRSIVSAFGSP